MSLVQSDVAALLGAIASTAVIVSSPSTATDTPDSNIVTLAASQLVATASAASQTPNALSALLGALPSDAAASIESAFSTSTTATSTTPSSTQSSFTTLISSQTSSTSSATSHTTHTSLPAVTTVTPTSVPLAQQSSNSTLSTGSIAGLAAGLTAAAVLVLLGVIYCLRQRRHGRPILPSFLALPRRNRQSALSADHVYPESAWLYDPEPSPPRRGDMGGGETPETTHDAYFDRAELADSPARGRATSDAALLGPRPGSGPAMRERDPPHPGPLTSSPSSSSLSPASAAFAAAVLGAGAGAMGRSRSALALARHDADDADTDPDDDDHPDEHALAADPSSPLLPSPLPLPSLSPAFTPRQVVGRYGDGGLEVMPMPTYAPAPVEKAGAEGAEEEDEESEEEEAVVEEAAEERFVALRASSERQGWLDVPTAPRPMRSRESSGSSASERRPLTAIFNDDEPQ